MGILTSRRRNEPDEYEPPHIGVFPNWFTDWLEPRWVRVTASVAMVALLGAVVMFRVAVAPTLTATRFTAWVAESPAQVFISVDNEEPVVHVMGGQIRLSEMYVTSDVVVVRSVEVGESQSGQEWVSIPLDQLDDAYRGLTAARITDAFSRGVRECVAPNNDGVSALRLFLVGPDAGLNNAICASGVFRGADAGEDVLVEHTRVRPSEVGAVPSDLAVLEDVDEPYRLVDLLNSMLVGS